jgi:hypothetical protein
MTLPLREGVHESERILVFEHLRARQFSANNPDEDVIPIVGAIEAHIPATSNVMLASYQARSMGTMAEASNLTERQAKYFASLRGSLRAATGKELDEWVTIARTCPEPGHRARLKWFKEHHGLLQNRAAYVLGQAFDSSTAWSEPEALIAALWQTPESREIYEGIDACARALPETIRTARKGYTAWSRTVQFAAARPLKGGAVMLGLALDPEPGSGLEAPKSETWSERLRWRLRVGSPREINTNLADRLRVAWSRS